MINETSVRMIAKQLAEEGFKLTSQWLIFSLENKDSPFQADVQDIQSAFRMEFRLLGSEFFYEPNYNEECIIKVTEIFNKALKGGQSKFRELTTKLIPLDSRVIENINSTDFFTRDWEKLDSEAKFRGFCQYYQVQWEGDYKFVKKSLIAMNKLDANKNIDITEELAVTVNNEKIESTSTIEDVIPQRLKDREYAHLRNSIAHSNYKYIKEEQKMEFWDLDKTQKYSSRPRKYSQKEFVKRLIEINVFCHAFSFSFVLLLALLDLQIVKSMP